MPELVIFDMDGLLFDSERAHMFIKREVMKEYGYELSEEVYVKTLGLSREDTGALMCSIYGADFPHQEIAAQCRRRLDAKAARESLPVKPGIPELLSYLTARGIPACLASSSPRHTVETYLRSAGLGHFFQFVITGDDILHSKPDPDIFLRCCRHFGTEPGASLVLEDSENGILAACRGEIPVICIPDMKSPSPSFAAMTVAVLPDAWQVMKYLGAASEEVTPSASAEKE